MEDRRKRGKLEEERLRAETIGGGERGEERKREGERGEWEREGDLELAKVGREG